MDSLFAMDAPLELLDRAVDPVQRGPYLMWRIADPSSAFDAAAQSRLLAMMEREASREHGGDYEDPYWSERGSYFEDISDWWVAAHEGEVAGWQGVALWRGPDGPVMYFDTLYVKPAHRATGISSCLSVEPLTRAIRDERAVVYPVLRTENPHVYRMFKKVFGGAVYPKLGGPGRRTRRDRAVRIARFAGQRMQPPCDVDPQTFVAKGVYADLVRSRDDAAPKARPDTAGRYFERHLDHGNGDALVVVAVPSRAGLLRLRLIDAAVRARIRAPVAEPEGETLSAATRPT